VPLDSFNIDLYAKAGAYLSDW